LDEHIRGRIDAKRTETQALIREFEQTSATLQAEVMNVLYLNYTDMTAFQKKQLQVHQEDIKIKTANAEKESHALRLKCETLRTQIYDIQTHVTKITNIYNNIQPNVDIPFPVASILSEPLLSTNTVPTGASLVFVEADELIIRNYSRNALSLNDHYLLSFARDQYGLIRVARLRLSQVPTIQENGVTIIRNRTQITNRTQPNELTTFEWSPHNYWIELYKERNDGTSVAVTRLHNISISSGSVSVPAPVVHQSGGYLFDIRTDQV